MASQGRGRRGRQRGSSQPPPGFEQQAFVETMGTAFTTIAQTSATGSHGRSSDLQRFRVHHHPTFIGAGEPVVPDH